MTKARLVVGATITRSPHNVTLPYLARFLIANEGAKPEAFTPLDRCFATLDEALDYATRECAFFRERGHTVAAPNILTTTPLHDAPRNAT